MESNKKVSLTPAQKAQNQMNRNQAANEARIAKKILKGAKTSVDKTLTTEVKSNKPKAMNKALKNLNRRQLALVSQVLTGRVAIPYPDDTQRRVNVNCLRTSFPFSQLIDLDGNFQLVIKPSLTETVTVGKSTTTPTSQIFQGQWDTTNAIIWNGASKFYTQVSGYSSALDHSSAGHNKAAGLVTRPISTSLYFLPELISSKDSSDIYPPSGNNTNIQGTATNLGYKVLGNGDKYTASVGLTAKPSNASSLQWWNQTTNAAVGNATTMNAAGEYIAQVVIGTTAGISVGDYIVPFVAVSANVPLGIDYYNVQYEAVSGQAVCNKILSMRRIS